MTGQIATGAMVLLLLVAAGIWCYLIVRVWAPAANRRGGKWYLEAQFIIAILTVAGIFMYPDDGSASIYGRGVAALKTVAVVLAALSILPALRAPRREVLPWATVIGLYYLSLTISAFAGASRELPESYWITPLILLAFVCNSGFTYEWLLRAARFTLRSVIALSFLAIIVFPDLAFNTVESRTVFGVNRLEGIAGHPNTLAFIAVLSVVLEFFWARNRWSRFWGSLATLALILAQSNTAWVALVVSLLFLGGRFGTLYRTAVAAAAVIAACIALFNSQFASALLAFTEGDSLNGRGGIWAAALSQFNAYPIFGYGPTLLDEQFRVPVLASGFTAAGQAHNQWVQVLGSAGLVGLVTFVLLTVALVVRAARSVRFDPVPIALLAALLIRSYAETPFRPVGVGIGTTILVVVICAVITAPREVPDAVPESEVRLWHRALGAARR